MTTPELKFDPAFPISGDADGFWGPGMSYRDWVASLAMHAILSSDILKEQFKDEELQKVIKQVISRAAFDMADAMIIARDSGTTDRNSEDE